MAIPEKTIQDSNAVAEQSPYLFSRPDRLITPEMKEWLKNATIVHIAPPWLPVPHEERNYGGIESVMEANIAALDEAGVGKQIVIGHPKNVLLEHQYDSVMTVTPMGIDPEEDLLKMLRTEPGKARSFERKYVHAAYQWVLDHKKEGNTVTVIHDHTNLGMRFGSFVNNDIPVVVTEHNALVIPYATERAQWELERYKDLERLGFIAISQDQMSQMPDLNWLGVVYNGVDLSKLEFSKRKEPYLLYLGRVTRDKGVHNAVRVAQALGMKLTIAGQVEETKAAQAYYASEIQPHLHHASINHISEGVKGQEKNNLLKHATALLMLVEWPEPFGMVMPEAQASGTPIVGKRRGSIPEVVGENTGYVVDNNEEAVEAVRRLLNGEFSPEECRRRVEQLFSYDVMSAEYVKMYMKQERAVRRRKANKRRRGRLIG